jgi:hypothetical protein
VDIESSAGAVSENDKSRHSGAVLRKENRSVLTGFCGRFHPLEPSETTTETHTLGFKRLVERYRLGKL